MNNHTKSKNSALCGACLYELSYKIEEFRALQRLFVWIIIQNRRIPRAAALVCMYYHTNWKYLTPRTDILYEYLYKTILIFAESGTNG